MTKQSTNTYKIICTLAIIILFLLIWFTTFYITGKLNLFDKYLDWIMILTPAPALILSYMIVLNTLKIVKFFKKKVGF